MKHVLMLLGLIATAGLVLGCAATAQGPNTDEMIAAADALDDAFLVAMNDGDAQAIAACYWNSPDVVSFTPGNLMLKGIDAVKAGAVEIGETMPGARFEVTEHHQMPAGDVVIGWGIFRATMPGPDGEEIEMVGRYTDVKAERDGKWVYLLDHASVPLPPPPSGM